MSHVTCIELIAYLDAYVDEELDADTHATFDLHLLVCPSCRAYLASYRETIELARGAAEKEEELATDAPPELIEAVLTSNHRAGKTKRSAGGSPAGPPPARRRF